MRYVRMVVLLVYLGITFINAALANEEYNITVPDYLDVEKNLTISNIMSHTDVTDAYDDAPWSLDWGDIHTPYKWNVTTQNGNVTIGFERYEIVSIQPRSMTFFRTVTEYLGSHVETRYREENQSQITGIITSTHSGIQSTDNGWENNSDNGTVNNSYGNNQKQKASGFEIASVIVVMLACIFYRKNI